MQSIVSCLQGRKEADLADAKLVQPLRSQAEGGDVGVAHICDGRLGHVKLQRIARRAARLTRAFCRQGIHVGDQALEDGARVLVLLGPRCCAHLPHNHHARSAKPVRHLHAAMVSMHPTCCTLALLHRMLATHCCAPQVGWGTACVMSQNGSLSLLLKFNLSRSLVHSRDPARNVMIGGRGLLMPAERHKIRQARTLGTSSLQAWRRS